MSFRTGTVNRPSLIYLRFYVQINNPTFFFVQANKNLDMSINASNNFNLNITWSLSSTGTKHIYGFILRTQQTLASVLQDGAVVAMTEVTCRI